jgi:small subunit ribosomal protein S18
MARNNDRSTSTSTRRIPKDNGRRIKKKPCALCKDRVEWVDYKDVGLLRKYMSDRGKIRARRVSGCCVQHQRDVAIAIKTARELVLLPYTQRTTTERPGGRGGRGGAGGGRRGRDEERTLSADATSSAVIENEEVIIDVVDAEGNETVYDVEAAVVELDTGEEAVIIESVEEITMDGDK